MPIEARKTTLGQVSKKSELVRYLRQWAEDRENMRDRLHLAANLIEEFVDASDFPTE
ncbi:MAG TPA: hypothetical protein VN861_02990 [Candidatus Acidoferrales bacterium]|nr:hypothetical protein [Candidatus Acidoferrales bacterium]